MSSAATTHWWSSAEDGARLLARADAAFRARRATPLEDRCAAALRLAEILERDGDAYADLITREMRKTIRASRAEVAKCAMLARFYAEAAPRILADDVIAVESGEARVRCEPLGVVLGIMPWNFPFWQVCRFAIPALLAGNSVLVKHSARVPDCAVALEQLMHEAGFGEAMFLNAAIDVQDVYPLIADDRVKAVILTGGVDAGSRVAAHAGRYVKKVVLELGGSDPFVVLPSANIDDAVAAAVRSRIHANGQACTAAKRFIVHRDLADAFEQRFAAALEALRVGDPTDDATDVGPLAGEDVVEKLDRQVRDTLAAGARLVTGGQRLGGTFYAPTLLSDVPLDAPAAQEETFGPVAALFRARDLGEAIDLANASRFGLGASVWTNDAREAEECIARLECGQVFVNAPVSSDPRLPFGGTKDSGFGRELGVAGLRELTNIKTVRIAPVSSSRA